MVLLRIFVLGRDTNTCAYIKRRLAMCARKLGRVKEAVKLMKEVKPVLYEPYFNDYKYSLSTEFVSAQVRGNNHWRTSQVRLNILNYRTLP